MKSKLFNLLLIITSLAGYLEWGGNRHSFLFHIEVEFFSKVFIDPVSILHPFTVLPLLGQIVLLFTLFQKNPSKPLTYIGITCLGVLLMFMFVIGILSLNFKILISTIPFLIVSALTIRHYKKMQRGES